MKMIRASGSLQNLVPIAVVVVGGCEPCAEKMVVQALEQGSSWDEVDETLRILADMQKRQCVIQALGADTVTRMEKPLAAGRRALEQAKPSKAAVGGCGCGGSLNHLAALAHK